MCSGCGQTWSGDNRSHCAACHETFGGVTSFDNHLPGQCKDPASLGLTRGADGIWKKPLSEDERKALGR